MNIGIAATAVETLPKIFYFIYGPLAVDSDAY